MRKALPSRRSASISMLKKELDILFSRYIRYRNTNARGLVVCYTCGREMQFKASPVWALSPSAVSPSPV